MASCRTNTGATAIDCRPLAFASLRYVRLDVCRDKVRKLWDLDVAHFCKSHGGQCDTPEPREPRTPVLRVRAPHSVNKHYQLSKDVVRPYWRGDRASDRYFPHRYCQTGTGGPLGT